MSRNRRVWQVFSAVLWVSVLVMTVWTVCHLLYSAYSALTWSKFTLFDYGVYTNMIWNCGHGDCFRVLVDDSYLSTHLSFSLALLGPLFRIWDHPMLLSFLQWAMIVAGGLLLWRGGRRYRVQPDAVLAVVFFFVGYRFTQGVALSEFHTYAAYFLLVPWLYLRLRARSNWAWLPLALILGVREDAFIFILPMMLYFAVRHRWRMGFVMVGAALLYGVAALFWLYPAINGISLFARRQSTTQVDVVGRLLSLADAPHRRYALFWTALPVLVFIDRRFLPAVLFPAAALLTAVFSGYGTQQGLGSHYGGPVIVCLAIGILESVIWRCERAAARPALRTWDLTLRALLLTGVTVAFHLYDGFLPHGGKNFDVYNAPSLSGKLAIRAARRLPDAGTLVTDNSLVGFCANRRDVLTWKRYDPSRHGLDLVFARTADLQHMREGLLRAMLASGEMGVRYRDAEYVILQRGYDTGGNAEALRSASYGPILLPLTARHGGQDHWSKAAGAVRYWEGKGHRGPINLSYGGYRRLEPGRYVAAFRYRARYPRKHVRDSWGWFSVHALNQPEAIAQHEIEPVETMPGDFRVQGVAFEIRAATDVEVRVTGADAELWLDRAMFFPHDTASPVIPLF